MKAVEGKRCLWDEDCPEYKSKASREIGWLELAEIFREERK